MLAAEACVAAYAGRAGEEIRRAILSHANFTGVTRVSALEKTLYALRRTGGVAHSVCLREARAQHLRGGNGVRQEEAEGQGFARGVNRDDIADGAAQLGVDLDQHISFCLEAMRARAAELRLAGSAADV